MKSELGDVRRSQVITTHGPGSIVDFRADSHGGAAISVVAAGLEEWDRAAPPPGLGHEQVVYEPRLQKQLDVDGFRLPPVAPQVAPGTHSPRAGKLIGVRFPRWLQCPSCRVIRQWREWAEDPGDPALYCFECSEKAGGRNRVHVVPVRFVVACENGHLDEFPWEWWVPHKDDCESRKSLRLDGSATAGLAGLRLVCLGCGESRSMEGVFGPKAIPPQCHGCRPWLGIGADEAGCTAPPRVVQRGASNLYFSVVESALDIPPWSDDLEKKIGMRWPLLEKAADSSARKLLIEALRLSEVTGKSALELESLIEDRVARLKAPDRNLRWEEYQQFVQHTAPFGANTEFEIHPSPAPPELVPWVRLVTRATRLREVRANTGFTRILPPVAGQTERVAKISLNPKTWLPAVENRGEGIFIQLDPERLRDWESRPNVVVRVDKIRAKFEAAWKDRGRTGPPPSKVNPRFLLIHSLSHALIRQLALNCGYGSASLRERIYVDTREKWDMSGLLVFTSSPDADGTLGGLARQGDPANIVRIFEDGLAAMIWCSSDPLCIEGVHSVSEPANGAACHACLLAAETSCEEFNGFLDRALLVGTAGDPALGFFKEFLDQSLQ